MDPNQCPTIEFEIMAAFSPKVERICQLVKVLAFSLSLQPFWGMFDNFLRPSEPHEIQKLLYMKPDPEMNPLAGVPAKEKHHFSSYMLIFWPI